MRPTDFLQLPPAVRTLVVVMLWPAIWAGALLSVAFAGDVTRQFKKRPSPARRKAA
jgi:hypothetical protein